MSTVLVSLCNGVHCIVVHSNSVHCDGASVICNNVHCNSVPFNCVHPNSVHCEGFLCNGVDWESIYCNVSTVILSAVIVSTVMVSIVSNNRWFKGIQCLLKDFAGIQILYKIIDYLFAVMIRVLNNGKKINVINCETPFLYCVLLWGSHLPEDWNNYH